MKLRSWVSIVGIAVSGIVTGGSFDRVSAITTTLYDGTSGVTPDLYTSNPYLEFKNVVGGTQGVSGGVTTLDTSSSNSFYAGYSNYKNDLSEFVNLSFPILDNNAGYTLSFRIATNSQTNSSPNRAGFSVIVLGSNKKGIEIGFRNPNTITNIPDIFAYNDNSTFTRGEQNASLVGILDTLNTYDLSISGNNYTLKNGSNPPLLSGTLRDYSPNATVGTLTQVYDTANFLFLGDDTSSAGGKVNIQSITLTTNPTTVPEPSNLLGIGLAIGLGATVKRKLAKIGGKFSKFD
jgi:hypothetical protein